MSLVVHALSRKKADEPVKFSCHFERFVKLSRVCVDPSM